MGDGDDSIGQESQLFSVRNQEPEYVEYTVERSPHLEIVQIVLDKKLLEATDRVARRMKQNRSALVREALKEHLLRLEVRSKEDRDRQGYAKRPQVRNESEIWEAEAAWPAE